MKLRAIMMMYLVFLLGCKGNEESVQAVPIVPSFVGDYAFSYQNGSASFVYEISLTENTKIYSRNDGSEFGSDCEYVVGMGHMKTSHKAGVFYNGRFAAKVLRDTTIQSKRRITISFSSSDYLNYEIPGWSKGHGIPDLPDTLVMEFSYHTPPSKEKCPMYAKFLKGGWKGQEFRKGEFDMKSGKYLFYW